ncbi:MAG: CPBP family intramembrane metalloprotease [Clostridia bacterium]|nr:CPBP family intramembrane metalloprotease [Clostridia bacterium]
MTEKKYELRKQIKSVRWMIFWVVLAQFAAEVLVEAVVSFMANPPHKYIQIALVELVAIGVPISIYAKTLWRSGNKQIKQELCLKPCGAGYIILAAILGVSGQFVMMLLNVPANFVINLVSGGASGEVIPVAERWYELLLGIFALVIIPAVLEEFWMRGIIFRAYNRCNTTAAVFFTALIFALLHLRINEALGFFFMGLVASVVLIKSKSLYASMVYHAFSNLTALLFSAHIMPWIIDFIWVAFAVITLIFVLTFWLLIKQKGGMKKTKTLRTSAIIITSLFSMPMIFSVITVVIKYFLLSGG